jgi:hypothetical protein
MPATTLEDVDQLTLEEPLAGDELNSLWVESASGRGSSVRAELRIRLTHAARAKAPFHALLAGHGGCGKSTELRYLARELSDAYDTLVVDVKRVSPLDLQYQDVLFLCFQTVVDYALKVKNIELDEATAERLIGWFDPVTVAAVDAQAARVGDASGSLSGRAARLYDAFTGRILGGGGPRQSARRHTEDRFDELIDNLRALIEGVERASPGRRMLLIVENLDKLDDPEVATRLFLHHRAQLLQVPCSVIYTLPMYLWYEPDPELFRGWDARYLLPMITVSDAPPSLLDRAEPQDVDKARAGREVLLEILAHRVAPEIMEEVARHWAVSYSGGVLRHLLFMVREAAIFAIIEGSPVVRYLHVERAFVRLRNEVKNLLAPSLARSEFTVEDVYRALGDVGDWPRRGLDMTLVARRLLQRLVLLEYNGQVWYNLHPAIRDYLRLREEELQNRARRTS